MRRWEGRIKPVPKRWHWASCISHLEMQILLLQPVLILHAQTWLMGLLISKKVVALVNPNHQPAQHTAITDNTKTQAFIFDI